MIISRKYKFIFIKTRKTASTSIEHYLSKYMEKDDVIATGGISQNTRALFFPSELRYLTKPSLLKEYYDDRSTIKTQCMFSASVLRDLMKRKRFWPHLPAYRVKERVPKEVWNNYFKFTIERNLWDKAISYYYFLKHSRESNISFEEYMRKHSCLNYPWYTDGEQIIVDYVGYYENLNEELDYIFGRFGIPFSGQLTERAKTQTRKDRRHYSEFFKNGYERYIDEIRRIYKKEIEMHGYTFDSN